MRFRRALDRGNVTEALSSALFYAERSPERKRRGPAATEPLQ
jgi:hypothetical protein